MGRLRSRAKVVGSAIRRAWHSVEPGRRAWRAAKFGVVAIYLLMLAVFATSQTGGGWWVESFAAMVLFGVVLAFLITALIDLVATIVGALGHAVPRGYWTIALGIAFMIAQLWIRNRGPLGTAVLVLAPIAAGSLLGGAVWTAIRRPRLTPSQRGTAIGGAALGTIVAVGGLVWYLWPGPATTPLAVDNRDVEPLSAPDPSLEGPYPVLSLTYGRGEDLGSPACRWRPEYCTEVGIQTGTVDGSAFVENWDGINGNLRSAYWGFGVTELPLNATVWYPQGEGPFPLAIIVHGNHHMVDHSDPGYAYLGELLASRGIILASVDENFLNGAWVDFIVPLSNESLKEENDARGWLLLEHLAQWRRWATTVGNPFYGKVAMDRVAVMGHSRGGEAAAIAASLSRLGAYPGDPTHTFNWDFDIRAVVAIAPVDGQYWPAGRRTPLADVSYLVIQGAYDGDMRAYDGIRQYNRVTFSPDSQAFKAAVYVDRANHGQFNTEWGRIDLSGFPTAGLLNLGPIMDAGDQQQIAKVVISAFLEATLNDRVNYVPLFRDVRRAGAWLPDVAFITRYDDARTAYLATFEEDVDPTTATVEGATVQGQHLTKWVEGMAESKWDDQGTSVVTLEWDTAEEPETATYSVRLGEAEPAATAMVAAALASPNAELTFALAGGDAESELVDLTVALLDSKGVTAQLPLSHFMPLQPKVAFHTWKLAGLERSDERWEEPVFQTFVFPLSDFRAASPGFSPALLVEIRFVFDLGEKGTVLLDDVGVRP